MAWLTADRQERFVSQSFPSGAKAESVSLGESAIPLAHSLLEMPEIG